MKSKILSAAAAVALSAAAALGIATSVNSMASAATYNDNTTEYYQCMDGCQQAWFEKDIECSKIGVRYSVSSYQYEICTWEREEAMSSCQLQCDRQYPQG